jgi:hypothetical protein
VEEPQPRDECEVCGAVPCGCALLEAQEDQCRQEEEGAWGEEGGEEEEAADPREGAAADGERAERMKIVSEAHVTQYMCKYEQRR